MRTLRADSERIPRPSLRNATLRHSTAREAVCLASPVEAEAIVNRYVPYSARQRRLTLVTARMRTAPTETRQRLNRGLTHPLESAEEGLAMEATRTTQPATRGARHG